MSKKRLLIVTQELSPYTEDTLISELAGKLPLYLNEKGYEIRILMPKFGSINERRHRLHEVVRLSGMNIIVDDDDYPLIIKVASLPGARLQVYFLDNDEFFKRKSMFTDDDGNAYTDNTDRMVFFCKGVIETVRKFGWSPDVIHCHGWMTSLIPAFIRSGYKNDPVFSSSTLVYTAYPHEMDNALQATFMDKALISHIEKEDLEGYFTNDQLLVDKGAMQFSDAVVKGSAELSEDVLKEIEKNGKPILDFSEENYPASHAEFYKQLLAQIATS
ncbi:MAG TPA: glycogen/starch synthase [Saprospiraceae bacterium]|nr:glycogen/starch synthase [Saprospiraceae bacterium]MCC6687652.1 glycogen/starch synthase [Saprospiraceae bacterium]HMV22796.1 glycogen/starch synthase [Saprospiraceae bacterium]HMX82508.1 glycogen/starch synthase [Saprospiraceae bacterium]HMX84535.1 glycogen/starch synthase [Saprospiraceae bacterium]